MPKIRLPFPPPDDLITLPAHSIRKIHFEDGACLHRFPGFWALSFTTPPGKPEFLRYDNYEIVAFESHTLALEALSRLRIYQTGQDQ